MKVSLDDMSLFIDIVEKNGIREAAKAKGLSIATVSRRLAKLESHLGVQLISRTTRTMSLTEYGEVFFGPCKKMVEYADTAKSCLQEAREKEQLLTRWHQSVMSS